ncbi:hypothetical protein J4Q44_G00209600 [Coregonus suidteri]|uniref:Immunoglobulin V-set domain-containing protein n=1 Tax=Coregonus suidteri TaxID=861788 RepID=A0AAN8LAK2_9TELE
MLWTTLMIMCTLLMMPEMTLQWMERKRDLGTLIFNTSQTQQGIFQWNVKPRRSPRATLLQEKLMIQLDKVGPDQLGEKSDQNVTKTRVEITLGKSAQLPCQCTRENSGEGKCRVQWEDNYGRSLDLLGAVALRKYALLNDKRRMKIEGDCTLYVYNSQQEDQEAYGGICRGTQIFKHGQYEWTGGSGTRKVWKCSDSIIDVALKVDTVEEMKCSGLHSSVIFFLY